MMKEEISLRDLVATVERARRALGGPATEALERALDAIRVADGGTEGSSPRSEALSAALEHARDVVADAYGQLRAAETVMWTLQHALQNEEHRERERQGGSPDAT